MEVVYDRAIAGDTGAQCVILLAVGGNFSVENSWVVLIGFFVPIIISLVRSRSFFPVFTYWNLKCKKKIENGRKKPKESLLFDLFAQTKTSLKFFKVRHIIFYFTHHHSQSTPASTPSNPKHAHHNFARTCILVCLFLFFDGGNLRRLLQSCRCDKR